MASVAEILLEQGRQRGAARRAEGQISAGTWTNLADIASRGFSQYAQEQQQAPIRAQEAEIRGLQLQGLKDERAAADASAQESAALKALFSRETPPEPDEIMSLVGPERGIKIVDGLAALQDVNLKRFKSQQEVIAATLAGMDALPEQARAEFYPSVRQNLIQRQIITEQDAPEAYDPNWFQQARGFGQTPQKVGTREIKTRNADGSESIQIVEDKPGFSVTSAPEPEKEYEVVVKGPDGRPVKKLVKASEMRQGVAQYQEPRVGAQPSYQWALDPRDGVVRLMSPEEIRSSGAGQAPTADMRNKVAMRPAVQRGIQAVRDLGEKIFTKVGPAQRAEAIKRGVEAVFGTDPDFRTYQDFRRAAAGALAVEQQGSRVSDADVEALWLPTIPDAYRDTRESFKLKWDMIDAMRGVQPATGDARVDKVWDPKTKTFKKVGG